MSPPPSIVAGAAHEIQLHRLGRQVQHAGEAAFGDLHQLAGLLVDGHRFPVGDRRAEDDPFAVRSPLRVGGVDLDVLVRFAGQEGQHRAGNRILDDLALGRELAADLGVAG
jgi:hypothetical protein